MSTIESLVHSAPVVLFIKGTHLAPACGFSNTVVQLLEYLKVPFTSVNVLDDDDVRQGIKNYSKWPTIPQVYVEGEFIGGHDILMEMYKNGSLQVRLQAHQNLSA